MAKIIEKSLTPDDPIFSSGPSVFVPVSRPSTRNSPERSEQLLDDVMKAQESKPAALKAKQQHLLEILKRGAGKKGTD